jgi:hypothetical protein
MEKTEHKEGEAMIVDHGTGRSNSTEKTWRRNKCPIRLIRQRFYHKNSKIANLLLEESGGEQHILGVQERKRVHVAKIKVARKEELRGCQTT